MSHTETKEVTYLDGHRVKVGRHVYQIERTCRYVRDHMGVADNWFSKCTECGAEFDERVVDSHFVYCPRCGAMVVGNDDR